MHPTQILADFVAGTDYADIPETALNQAKAGILDWVFVSLAGRKLEDRFIGNLERLILSKRGNPESTIMGSKTRIPENQAALLNGCLGHALDYDETCPKVRSHLFASIFPSILAASEHRGLSGKEMLTAFIIGHESAMRVGEAITPQWIRAGWHGTSLFGIFGAAMGCARILKLDVQRTRMALGLASSMASGVAVNFGSNAKCLHAGVAAERGLFAAQLAQSGISANPDGLEGALGFYHAYNWGEAAQEECFHALGKPWGLETPGISAIKLYPCCHGLATNIECGLRIHRKFRPALEDIEAIEIHSQPKTLCAMLSRVYDDTGESIQWGYEGPPRQMKTVLPQTGAQAKFSKEYAFSRALLSGEVSMRHLTDEAVNEPEVRRWMEKIRVYHNSEMEDYSNRYPEEQGPHAERMIVRFKDGRIIQEEEIFILGMAKRPLSFKDVESKYQDCGGAAGLKDRKIEQIIALIVNLERYGNVAVLMEQLNNED